MRAVEPMLADAERAWKAWVGGTDPGETIS